MKLFYIFIAFFLANLQVFSQIKGLELYEKVMIELPRNEVSKLKKVGELYEQAENLLQEADKMNQNIDRINVKLPYASKKEKKIYNKNLKKLRAKSVENKLLASQIYTNANDLLYSVFKKNIHIVKNNKNKEATLLAELLEKEADEHHRASIALNRLLEENKIPEKQLPEIIDEIRNLESLSINKLASIYGLYLRWSDTLNKYKSKLKPAQDQDLAFISDITSNDTLNSNNDKIVFSIQIDSRKEVFSKEELLKLKTRFPHIQIVMEDSWLIYSVGAYSNYIDAVEKKENDEEFIVAFKNGVKIEIDKALYEN